jgi:7-keto-8-aminopelargonate synthetase-like enzyme
MDKLMKQALDVVRYSRSIGIAHIETDGSHFDGHIMPINDADKTQFSLCDYLALSTHQSLREGAAKFAMDYGVYTAVSRTYLKLKPLADTERQLTELFGYPTLAVPRTTLGHVAVLPVLVGKNDLMIMDHQVHTSVKIAVQTASEQGAKIEMVRHNRMDLLEEMILAHQNSYEKIWYLADGIYSMYGDTLPAQELERLLNTYDNFYAYVDDAHGMSWIGKQGIGYTLTEMDLHEKMIVSTSLGKGFGSGGGAIICPNEEIRDQIEILGAPVMFSSPLCPPTLGAIQASIKIHQSDEIYELQKGLIERIVFARTKAEELQLPIIHGFETPIIYLATGKPNMTSNIARSMLRRGFHVTGGVYPAVPFNNSGIRLVISMHQSMQDISNLFEVLKEEYEKELDNEGVDLSKLLRHYKNVSFKV